MATIELREVARPDNRDFEPVDLGNGVVLNFIMRSEDGRRVIRGTAVRGGNEIGYGSWNEEYGRFSMHVEFSDKYDSREVTEAIYSGLMQILGNK